MEKNDEIRFYNKLTEYYEFSNFYECPINIDGKIWMTSEHYYQAQKYVEDEYKELIRLCDTPMKAFRLARQRLGYGYDAKWVINKHSYQVLINVAIADAINKGIKMRADWDEIKISVMEKILYAKFTQHAHLKKMLKDTQNAKLIEASPIDPFWGEGKDKKGHNHLGKLLMKLRSTL